MNSDTFLLSELSEMQWKRKKLIHTLKWIEQILVLLSFYYKMNNLQIT